MGVGFNFFGRKAEKLKCFSCPLVDMVADSHFARSALSHLELDPDSEVRISSELLR